MPRARTNLTWSGGDLFVQPHGREDATDFAEQKDVCGRQGRAPQKGFDASNVVARQASDIGRNPRRRDLPEDMGFAVQYFPPDCLDGVANGVAKVQDGAQTRFACCVSSWLTTSALISQLLGDDFGEGIRVALKKLGISAFQTGEQSGVVNDPG